MLTGEFPQISHLREHGLSSADDSAIWNFAKERGYTIVTKDRDFEALNAEIKGLYAQWEELAASLEGS